MADEPTSPAETEGRPRVLASTTSHKREPLPLTLEVFARLGLRDLDLNLHHLLEGGLPVEAVDEAAARHDLRVWVLSGGWCDFFDLPPAIDRTFSSVDRQVGFARRLGARQLRLFFGRLQVDDYTSAARTTVRDNLLRLSDRYPDMRFAFENHDGASLRPEVCREILEAVDRPNVRLNLDPINFAKAGVDPLGAAAQLLPLVGHVHLKGLERGEYCEYGEGDVPLAPVLDLLVQGGYAGAFTVEYEGQADGTLRLYRSVERARIDVAARS